ncbi:sensor histidine kinase [Microbacterium sp. NPDC091313]
MSTSAEPELTRDAQERLERRLTGLAALAGLLFLLGTAPVLAVFPHVAWWWVAGAVVMLFFHVLLVVGHLRISLGCLRFAWRAIAVVCWALEFTIFLAWSPADADALQPWIWPLLPAGVMLIGLLCPTWKAIAWTLGIALAPLVSALIFAGGVHDGVLHNTPLALTGVTLVLILTSVRSRLRQSFAAEAAARDSERRSALARAEAEQQHALARLVHDDVLAVLTAAMQLGGRIPDELRSEARAALAVLTREAPPAAPDAPVPPESAASELAAVVREIAPAALVVISATPGELPRAVVEAFSRAVGEAARNSVRHAGPAAIELHVMAGDGALSTILRDNGLGFAPDRVDPERMGVRESIVGRIRSLRGGQAHVRSHPGDGTEVTLAWHR